jgi:hypothetical protein
LHKKHIVETKPIKANDSFKLANLSNYSEEYSFLTINGVNYKKWAVPGDGSCFFLYFKSWGRGR